MADITLKIRGMEATLRALQKAPEVVKKKADDVVGINAALLSHAVNPPIGATGELALGIDWDHQEGSLRAGVGIKKGSPAARYWYFVEMGTVDRAGQPFFRPAAEAHMSRYVQEFRDIGPEIERELEQ